MMRRISRTGLFVACFWLASVAATAQEVVHAMTGTVNDVNQSAKTITIFNADGSGGTFKDLTNPGARIDFDKKIRADATEATAFDKKGTYAIIYYFGNGDSRTAVAVRSLGSGPFTKNIGTVAKFDGRAHLLSIQDSSGKVESFKIDADTVAETGMGVVEGFKFQPQKDEQVQVIASTVNGSATALFVVAM
jgi:uncharacterized protein YigE (DUF2233 family)